MAIEWRLFIDLIAAIAWPAVVAFALYLFRRPLVELVSQIAGRAQKLSIYNVSVELATLPELTTSWTVQSTDVRRLTSSQIFDSISQTLFQELLKVGKADYAVVDLRTGGSWLTSRLYIFALVLGAARGLRAFVFLETSGGVRRRYLGVATPESIQKALAARYPWFEEAYFRAAAPVSPTEQTDQPRISKFLNPVPLFTSDEQWRISNFVQNFIQIIQRTTMPPTDELSSYLEMGTKDFLFSAGLNFQSDLQQRMLTPAFRQEFENNNVLLSADNLLSIMTEADGNRWRIIDPENQTYSAIVEGDELNIYRETQMWERTRWIDGEQLERDLAGHLDYDWYQDSPDQARSIAKEAIARRAGTFVALVDEDRRFVGLVDRHALMDQMWKEQETEMAKS